jgi:hypothetical protein
MGLCSLAFCRDLGLFLALAQSVQRVAPSSMHRVDQNGESQYLKNQRVYFHISDACVPAPLQILAELHGQDLLHGQIIGLCDYGIERNTYAVVEVERIGQQVVVPVAKIFRIPESSSDAIDSSISTDPGAATAN